MEPEEKPLDEAIDAGTPNVEESLTDTDDGDDDDSDLDDE